MSTTVANLIESPRDPAMPFLLQALDPDEAAALLTPALVKWTGADSRVDLLSTQLVRHKPGRRCLIEYQVAIERPGAPVEQVRLLGKVRAKGIDFASFRVQAHLYAHGFSPGAPDGIQVPEPIGVVPALHMWLQRAVPGQPATALLAGPNGAIVARRIAEASHKLHSTSAPTQRRHTIADELRILRERLALVATLRPNWAERLERLMDRCERLACRLPQPHERGIHRDYYADQLIVAGPRTYLVDLDLYCRGDPGLDIGNAIAHITEQALRMTGDPTALSDREREMEERFVELAGEAARSVVHTYTTLTLARHIGLSTQLPGRGHTTQPLLELCEERLHAV